MNQQQMTDQIELEREWYSISQTQFSYFYPDQVRKISCCEVSNPQVYDSNKVPFKNGLYSPAMGISPNDRDTTCQTCGHYGMKCSGHPGHIQLILPVYNPMIVDILVKLLRMNCFHCHRFRIKQKIKQEWEVAMVLIKNNMINQAKMYFEIDEQTEKRKFIKLERQKPKEKQQASVKQLYQQKVEECVKNIEKIQKIKEKFVQLTKNKNIKDHNTTPTSASIEQFSKFVKFLYSIIQNKCPYCKNLAKTVKKEGANKIFIITSAKDAKMQQRKKSRDSTSRGQSASHGEQTQQNTNRQSKKRTQKFLTQKQIYKQMRHLWTNEQRIVDLIFGNSKVTNSFTMFFLTCVFVPPSRFRPQSKMGEQRYLHDHTSILGRILQLNDDLKMMIIFERIGQITDRQGEKNKKARIAEFRAIKTQDLKKIEWVPAALKKLKGKPEFINKWLQLQDAINCFMDSTKSSKMSDKDFKGIRQILEKKQGLFRMKMMGKRVNYAARSVISPDPSLNTDEVGIPLFMAKKLTFAEPVNQYNIQKLKMYVKNGKNFPGANFLEQNGRLIKLQYLNDQQRLSHARNLLINSENKVVYRHLADGDNVMFNRQPTLHKPGLMAHRIKVLPKQSTLRMNYANCKSYNADFDGDEMNLHALQNYMAKAQAQLCISDKMYNNPTNGNPLREIMQDAVIAAVYMTMKDTFYNKKDYSQLLYQATFSLFEKKPKNTRIFLVHPSIVKPKQLWTGKQLVTNVIKIVVALSDLKFKDQRGLDMKSTTKIAKQYLKGYQEQSEVIFQDNQLIKGIIDKNQVGSGAQFGFVHSFNQMYGETTTGKLITSLTKLFLAYIQVHGFTCGLDDLIIEKKANKARKQMIDNGHTKTVQQICQIFNSKAPQNIDYYGRSAYKCDENGEYIQREQKRIHLKQNQQILHHLESKVVHEEDALEELDREYKFHLKEKSSKIIDTCLVGFKKMFPVNNFSMMTVTGAKGSNVNHSQVAVMLGQQQLEGRRVPVMISGKTLPCYLAYDPNPRASGYICDRFLTGLREQQFYFHCMAGREGLIDTAVKTSRSGYLQRCLMKHLQTLKVEYDYTVRDCDGSIVQFYYGQDSLDPARQKFFGKLDYITSNFETLKKKYKYQQVKDMMKFDPIKQFKSKQTKTTTTIMQKFPPGRNLGSISEKCYNYIKNSSKQFSEVYSLKYLHDMIQPGESVGCTAAQSIGEPSTQMTLNTFHLAGHGGVNVTLGIPRLRQLLMTSTDKIKTPIMTIPFKDKSLPKQQAENFAKKLQKIKFSELVRDIQVSQWKQLINQQNQKLLAHNQRKRFYRIYLNYQPQKFVKQQFEITYEDMNDKVRKTVVPMLLNHINRVKKKNQLRVQIKRVTATDKPQDDEQEKPERQEKEQNEEIVDQKQKALLDAIKNSKIIDQAQEENQEKYIAKQFQKLTFNKNGAEIIVKVSLNLKKFLMTKVMEKILKSTILREMPGISSATIIFQKKEMFIQTAGVNFNILTQLDFFNEIDLNKISSNDIQAIAKKYGIQAARSTLVRQIVTLFKAYGVTVDYRHLYLIGDYVTFGGNIKAMNRNWMAYSPSPFLRMSYETSVKFITGAALHCQSDNGKSPSSRIILGQNPNLGTGMCDILMDTGL